MGHQENSRENRARCRRKEEDIRVKQSDGTLGAQRLVIRLAVQGPVLAENNGKALPLRVAGLDQPHMLEEWWDLGHANNLEEFETVLCRL